MLKETNILKYYKLKILPISYKKCNRNLLWKQSKSKDKHPINRRTYN